MKDLSATFKGLITGLLMVAFATGIYYIKGNLDNQLIYIVYGTYIAGILWALFSFQRSAAESKTFKNYFSQGFRCFVVCTLFMVLFTWLFYKFNTGPRDEMLKDYRNDLLGKKNYTPAEIDNMIGQAKQYFLAMRTSVAIFGYLIIGSLVTAIASAFLSQQKKQ